MLELARRDPQRLRDSSARHYVGLPGCAGASLSTVLSLAARSLGFPAALLSVVDATRTTTLTQVGAGTVDPLAREVTLCDLVATTGEVVAIGRSADVPTQRRPSMTGWEAYLGVPVLGREARVIGALCLLDVRARDITPAQVAGLVELARVVEDQLDLLRRRREGALTGSLTPAALATALTAGHVVPWYQPVVDLQGGGVVALEALARWEHPELGVLGPSSFIPAAEDSDLVVELDLAVLAAALRDLAVWRATYPALRMSVNLSGKHVASPGCADVLAAVTAHAGVDPAWVDLEITETSSVGLDGDHAHALSRLRGQGFRVLLDDFGTGFSVLEHLLRLPVDGVKIDRVITAGLGRAKPDAVVRGVLGVCRDLALDTVIEGVETAAGAARAADLGCRHAQGFLFSPPVAAAHVPELLAAPVRPLGTRPGRAEDTPRH